MTTLTRDIHTQDPDIATRDKTATVASVSDQDWHISRTYGMFHIPARKQNEPCALVVVTPRGDAIDLGDNHRFPFTISARDIAEDIIQDLGNHGVFVCAGELPSEEELSRLARAATRGISSLSPKRTRCGRAVIRIAKSRTCTGALPWPWASNANGRTSRRGRWTAPRAAKK